jgi:predicted amidohydrolase
MNVHCVQLDCVWENKPASFARVRALLDASPPEAGSLVLLPEMFATGFSLNPEGVAEPEGGGTETFLAMLARRFAVCLVGGLSQAGPGGKARNVAVAFSPQGEVLARYAKLQPFTPGGEAERHEPGAGPVLFEWQGFVVALFICYDLRFPEHFRAAARRGAELYAVIASWPSARSQHWVTLLQARAIENQAYVAGVNRCGNDPKFAYAGRSLIAGPRGDILADAGNGESVIRAAADRAGLLAYRTELPFLRDMR